MKQAAEDRVVAAENKATRSVVRAAERATEAEAAAVDAEIAVTEDAIRTDRRLEAELRGLSARERLLRHDLLRDRYGLPSELSLIGADGALIEAEVALVGRKLELERERAKEVAAEKDAMR